MAAFKMHVPVRPEENFKAPLSTSTTKPSLSEAQAMATISAAVETVARRFKAPTPNVSICVTQIGGNSVRRGTNGTTPGRTYPASHAAAESREAVSTNRRTPNSEPCRG